MATKEGQGLVRECALYWLHLPDMHNIYEQGYVGITIVGVGNRLKQHIACAKKGGYKAAFREALLKNDLVVKTILMGSVAYIKMMERYFRPETNIGWNVAIGGDGGVVKHGLSGSKIKSCYYSTLAKAKLNGDVVDSRWLGDGGLERFAEDVLPIPAGKEFTRLDSSLPYTKENCAWQTRSEILRKCGGVMWQGKDCSYIELAEIAGISANTMQYRLYRGWSVEEALNIVPRNVRLVVDFNGDLVRYSGRLTDKEIEDILEFRYSGETITSIGDAFDIDSSQISRLCSRLKVPND